MEIAIWNTNFRSIMHMDMLEPIKLKYSAMIFGGSKNLLKLSNKGHQ